MPHCLLSFIFATLPGTSLRQSPGLGTSCMSSTLYSALPPAQRIRLPTVKLVRGRLFGRLEVYPLGQCPGFVVLLYTKGDQPVRGDILDLGRLSRFDKSEEALGRFSHIGLQKSVRIDVVYHDQDDDIEKNHQISLMRDNLRTSRIKYAELGSAEKVDGNCCPQSQAWLKASSREGNELSGLMLQQTAAIFGCLGRSCF